MDSLYNARTCPDPHVDRFVSLLRPGSRILDLGAGNGRHSLYLAGFGHDVIAVDSDPDRVEECNLLCRAYGRPGIRHRALELDIRDAIFADQEFDAVICTYVFQHLALADIERVLRTVFRLTAPGGHSLTVAYMGHRTIDRPLRTRVAEGELALTMANHGWDVVYNADEVIPPTIEPGGRILTNSRSAIIGRKPVSQKPAASPEAHILDPNYLRQADEEYYGDVIDPGFKFGA